MKRLVLLTLILLSSYSVRYAPAQTSENPFSRLEIDSGLQRPPGRDGRLPDRSAQIKNMQVFGQSSGIVYTDTALYRTDDNGETWRELPLPGTVSISGVMFTDEHTGWLALYDRSNYNLSIFNTADGGVSWTRRALELTETDRAEGNLEDVAIYFNKDGTGRGMIEFGLVSSSNFERTVYYSTLDGAESWVRNDENVVIKTSEMNRPVQTLKEYFRDFDILGVNGPSDIPDENIIKHNRVPLCAGYSLHSTWYVTQIGQCLGFKTNCRQETRLYEDTSKFPNKETYVVSVKEITPPQIKELAIAQKETARTNAGPVFSTPPGGSTRFSLNRGFDKCTAATASQMQTWWNNSPFYNANIYISGRNRGCSQPQLTAAWVNQVSAMGWGLIPTIVGYQAPCSVCTSCQKHSSDPATAEMQGRGEADIAIADANNLGLTAGTVLYYDMERYDDVSGTGACSTPVKAFLKGWTDRLKELGYVSGVYGSPTNAVGDWLNIPLASRMDAVWLARWDNINSVWTYASPSPAVPTNVWNNHQRIKQYQAPHDETWGGVTFNIDGNTLDGPVAGVTIPKNKNADFDGDGKTDISVYRPDNGYWYMLNSSSGAFGAIPFGVDTDIITPGDYDGDGKTDLAVFRPSVGDWYILTKAGQFSARRFGSAGDIPVPADFNGDGKTDVAVFRPSDGVWYIAYSDSLGTYNFTAFGTAGDKPVPADYDGDGKTDLAVFRPSDGNWYVLRSSDGGFTGTHFGIAADRPVQGDYDGDGKADPAVYRDGMWYILKSTTGFFGISFGLAGDIPASGDFDGDNFMDVAVYRPSDATWYVLQSQNGFFGLTFGLITDRPVPNAYFPQ